MKKLINETTKQMRQEYVQQMFQCKHGDCENCGVCTIFRGTTPEIVFQDYIDGKMEFVEVSRVWNAKKKW